MSKKKEFIPKIGLTLEDKNNKIYIIRQLYEEAALCQWSEFDGDVLYTGLVTMLYKDLAKMKVVME